MWFHRVGIKKSHYYPASLQAESVNRTAACGVEHKHSLLVNEADTKTRCTVCTRAYEAEMGLFA